MAELRYATYHSPFGPLTMGVTEKGLAFLHIGSDLPVFSRFLSPTQDEADVAPYWAALEPYFSTGDLPDLPLDLRGTEFQVRCWKYLCSIPKGETRSYTELARAVSSEKAIRAAGQANARNPIAIVVPCHRVIAADGTLGGYAGGLPMKAALLDLEGAKYRSLTRAKAANQAELLFPQPPIR
jgi:methylated-DNA-[protein]-cysteine S-methyltransferase